MEANFTEKPNVIKDKSYDFALKVVKLYRRMLKENEFVLSKQLVRSATSIGSNIEEGTQGVSKADFINKLSISLKESFETHYWLRLLRDAEFLDRREADLLINDCTELKRILISIVNTSRNKR